MSDYSLDPLVSLLISPTLEIKQIVQFHDAEKEVHSGPDYLRSLISFRLWHHHEFKILCTPFSRHGNASCMTKAYSRSPHLAAVF